MKIFDIDSQFLIAEACRIHEEISVKHDMDVQSLGRGGLLGKNPKRTRRHGCLILIEDTSSNTSFVHSFKEEPNKEIVDFNEVKLNNFIDHGMKEAAAKARSMGLIGKEIDMSNDKAFFNRCTQLINQLIIHKDHVSSYQNCKYDFPDRYTGSAIRVKNGIAAFCGFSPFSTDSYDELCLVKICFSLHLLSSDEVRDIARISDNRDLYEIVEDEE